jgi:hypothetical protein
MIKIEVTGASTAEVADKMLAIGNSLKNGAAVWWTQTDAPEKLRRTLRAELEAEMSPVMPEVAEAAFPPFAPEVAVAPGEPTAGPAAPEPVAETAEAGSNAPTATASPSEPTEPRSLISAEALRDLVLRVVKLRGREAMVEVLDTFGAAKASDVAAEQVPELVTALEALL